VLEIRWLSLADALPLSVKFDPKIVSEEQKDNETR